ncbi:hypothetical protein [Parasphingorhabdus pacifica]
MRDAVVATLRPAGMWTDRHGVVHLRAAATGRTFCGYEVGLYTNTAPTIGCGACVAESIRDFARTHSCGSRCHG